MGWCSIAAISTRSGVAGRAIVTFGLELRRSSPCKTPQVQQGPGRKTPCSRSSGRLCFAG